ncbi:MAG TPA: TolC family protein [Trinickia sp.]|nr:TolC family protein [Trinickia sp.]
MRRLLPLLLFSAVAGCTTYHPQPIAPEDFARRFEQRSLASDGLHRYVAQTRGHDVSPWPPVMWNRSLLTLAAWYYSPSLRLARAHADTVRAGIGVASAVPNPTLSLPFEYSSPNPGPGLPFTTGPALDIPIETAGKRGYRVDQATHAAQAVKFDLDTQAWKTGAQVRDALVSLYGAQMHEQASARRASDETNIVAMLQKRRTAGATSSTDVQAAVLAMQLAQHDLASARAAQSDARAQLAAAIGVPPSAVDDIRIDWSSLASAPPAPPDHEAQRDAIFHRTDLLASLADYAACESALQLEVAKQYPDIHLGPGYTYDTGTRRFAFGLAGISLPIFDQNQGGIREAERKRKEAAVRTEAIQDKILGDLDQALVHYRATLHALRLADDQTRTARKQLADQAAAFSAGDIDRLAYTHAMADDETTELARMDALVAAQRSAAAVEDAMQRPLDQGANVIYMQSHRQEEDR